MKDATAPITIKVIGGTPTPTEFPWWLLAVAVVGVGSVGVYAVTKKQTSKKTSHRR